MDQQFCGPMLSKTVVKLEPDIACYSTKMI